MNEERCQEFLTKFEDERFEGRLNKVEETLELKADKSVVNNLDTKTLRLEGTIANLADISRLNRKVDSVRFEPAEKNKRRNNVIIKGLPEDGALHDDDLVKHVLEDIGCSDVTTTETTILGKKYTSRTPANNSQENPSADSADVDQSQVRQ